MIGLKVEYKIDNFSGLIEISEDIWPKSKTIGCYFLFDENKQVIYIGKSTACIRTRLRQHLFTKNHYWSEHEEMLNLEKRKHYKYYGYCVMPIRFVEIMEIFLIKRFNPIFNSQYNSSYKPPRICQEDEEIDDIYLNLNTNRK